MNKDFESLEYLNTCGECNNSIIDGKCHICNNLKKFRKNRFLTQMAIEKLFNYNLPVYLNQEILPEYSSIECEYVIKKHNNQGIFKHCLLIDTYQNKADLTLRKIYNIFNLSIAHNFTFYYLIIDNTKPNIITNFLINYYPNIEDDKHKKFKHYTYCKNIVVNKSKLDLSKLDEILQIYNMKLSVTKAKKENEYFIILIKLEKYFKKNKKRGIKNLTDLNAIAQFPQYDEIYESIETLINILTSNKYDIPDLSFLLFKENKFSITKITDKILIKKFNTKLKLIKYKISKSCITNC